MLAGTLKCKSPILENLGDSASICITNCMFEFAKPQGITYEVNGMRKPVVPSLLRFFGCRRVGILFKDIVADLLDVCRGWLPFFQLRLGGVGHCFAWHVRVPMGLIDYYV